jgi:hypothetical protein
MDPIPFNTPAPRLVKGVTANAPASHSDSLYVRIPSRGTQDTHLVRYWDPHGLAIPSANVDCLLAEDQDGGLWLIQWVGGWNIGL